MNIFFKRASWSLLATALLPLWCSSAFASGAWIARHGMTASSYQNNFNTIVGNGYRLTDVSGYTVNGQPRFAALWNQSSSAQSPWVAHHNMTSAQYQQKFDQYVSQGYQLIDVSGYEVNGTDRYAAFWQKRDPNTVWQARHGMSAAQYQQTFNQLVGQGYRLVHINGYSIGGNSRFAAIWIKGGGTPWQARHGMSAAQYQQTFNQLVSQGYRLTDVTGYEENGQARYAAIWIKSGSFPWQARHGMSAAQYQQTFDQLVGQGYRLTHVDGYTVNGQDRYAAIWWKI
ncbi:hypothetical protein [Lyngbya confervoides]|uniref:Uncharacterized protein n=1 Tax=Lyngbya confervoides BDU141951 TaxID=1574623 RepID=A0ABD4T2C2_9CYAN|nr:hypothetical protein [Lyngbya confervoides]MCM1982590.1 hypothetical protein [Lyngbya confervoides BDU141951]